MNQKKTMELWQMIMLFILSAAIVATMFLPAYHFDSDTLEKGMKNAQSKDDYYDDEDARDKDIKRYTKKFNKAIKKEEKENDTDNASISVLKLMTKSLADIRYNGKYDEKYTKSEMGSKTYDALNKKHRMTKILLWAVYSLALLVILITILGYCLKWNKYIPLAISAVYGILASAAFAVLRFGTISGVKKEVVKLTEEFIGGHQFKNIDNAKLVSGFLSYAFLLGLAVAVVLLAVSVISMFVGSQAEMGYGSASDSYPMEQWDEDWNAGGYPGGMQPDDSTTGFQTLPAPGAGMEQREPEPDYFDGPGAAPFMAENQSPANIEIPKTPPLQQAVPLDMPVQEPPKKPVAKNGKVRCTKGATSGSPGYSLPQDRKVIVGKSPRQANLVIVNNTHISNVHCTIRYNAKANTYIVKDHSTNGTFVNGARLQKEVSMEYPPGIVLSLADGSAEITLG